MKTCLSLQLITRGCLQATRNYPDTCRDRIQILGFARQLHDFHMSTRKQRKLLIHWTLHFNLISNLPQKRCLKMHYIILMGIFGIHTSKPALMTKDSNLGSCFYFEGTDHLHKDYTKCMKDYAEKRLSQKP